jgi:hypothetical protein
MAEIVVGRFRPSPGMPLESFEIPGPGLYEADFEVPDFLLVDFESNRHLEFIRDGKLIEHLRTVVKGPLLTMRFRVTELQDASVKPPQTAEVVTLTVAVVARAVFGVILGALAVLVVKGIVDGLREVRKLAETPGGSLLTAGAGLALAAAAFMIFSRKAG